MNQEAVAGSAAAITLLGVWLCWRSPGHRISIEERTKDGLLTTEQGRARIRMVAWLGPVVTTLGCAALIAALVWG